MLGEESQDPVGEECLRLTLAPQLLEWTGRSSLAGAGIALVHPVEELDAVAEMEMIGVVEDVERSVGAEASEERE